MNGDFPYLLIANLLFSDSIHIKPSIQYLQGKVTDAIEHGIQIKKVPNYDDNLEYVPQTMTGGTATDVAFDIDTFHIIWMHTHPFKTSDGMFSFGDVRLLNIGYEECGVQRKEEVTLIMVSKNPQGVINTYAIKVDNIQTLTTKVNEVWNNLDYVGISDDAKLEKIHEKQSLEYFYYGQDQVEFSFLMQFQGFGISLYKANADLTSWSKLELEADNSFLPPYNVNESPCN